LEDFHCSFCGRKRLEVRKLISGPRVFICDVCVASCRQIVGSPPYPDGELTVHERERQCSFCGKRRHEVEAMVNAPTVLLCNECLDLCESIVAEEVGSPP
jgi:ATP-dependent Clp protease ATP-binding subunit ClpX